MCTKLSLVLYLNSIITLFQIFRLSHFRIFDKLSCTVLMCFACIVIASRFLYCLLIIIYFYTTPLQEHKANLWNWYVATFYFVLCIILSLILLCMKLLCSSFACVSCLVVTIYDSMSQFIYFIFLCLLSIIYTDYIYESILLTDYYL
jgi:hypothetical protein